MHGLLIFNAHITVKTDNCTWGLKKRFGVILAHFAQTWSGLKTCGLKTCGLKYVFRVNNGVFCDATGLVFEWSYSGGLYWSLIQLYSQC